MSIEASLTYQKKFFNDFTDAWHKSHVIAFIRD